MAPFFNVDEYEMVKDRIPLFYEQNPDGRITAEILEMTDRHAVVKAYLWKNAEEQGLNVPLATGIARDLAGGTIEKFYENCETSAIGRALANLNMFAKNRPSLEEMQSADSIKNSQPQPKSSTSQTTPQRTVSSDNDWCEEHSKPWTQSDRQIELGFKPSHSYKDKNNKTLWCEQPTEAALPLIDDDKASLQGTQAHPIEVKTLDQLDAALASQGWTKADLQTCLTETLGAFLEEGGTYSLAWEHMCSFKKRLDLIAA
jgi:hypothetical protein